MKKIFALSLALVLICLGALAEEMPTTAVSLTLDNLVLDGAQLGDLEVSAALDTAEALRLGFTARGGGETLVYAEGLLNEEGFTFAQEGDEEAYFMSLSEIGLAPDQAQMIFAYLPAMIPTLENLSVPMIPGLPIPAFDLGALLGASEDGRFTIPAEQVDALLDQASAYASYTPQLKELLTQLEPLRGQLSLDGHSTAGESGIQTDVDVLLQGNVFARISVTSAENSLNLGLSMDGAPMGSLQLTSEPEKERLLLTLEAQGMTMGTLEVNREAGLQRVAVRGEGLGECAMLYGQLEGVDQLICRLTMDGSPSSIEIRSTREGHLREGTIDLDIEGTTASCAFGLETGNFTLGNLTFPEQKASFDQLDPNALLAPIMEYLGTMMADAA